jgi:hypothetical protein
MAQSGGLVPPEVSKVGGARAKFLELAGWPRRKCYLRRGLVEGKVQFQHVDAGLAEDAELAAGGIGYHKLAQGGGTQAARRGHAGSSPVMAARRPPEFNLPGH